MLLALDIGNTNIVAGVWDGASWQAWRLSTQRERTGDELAAFLKAAFDLPDDELPVNQPVEGPPPPHRWAERDPVAAARLQRCRQVVIATAEAHTLPPENLVSPDFIRRLAWSPPAETTPQTVGDTLRGFGARNWQVGLLADELAKVLPDPPAATG